MRVNRVSLIIAALVMMQFLPHALYGQGPKGRDFGFGISLGDPLGATVKFWQSRENSITASLGGSYFGGPRIGADYLWHFDVFHSQVVTMYAGPGAVLGFGEGGKGILYGNNRNKDKFYYRDDEIGIGVRVIVGINVIPKRSPVEIFAELGPLMGLIPNFGVGTDLALGVRFYP